MWEKIKTSAIAVTTSGVYLTVWAMQFTIRKLFIWVTKWEVMKQERLSQCLFQQLLGAGDQQWAAIISTSHLHSSGPHLPIFQLQEKEETGDFIQTTLPHTCSTHETTLSNLSITDFMSHQATNELIYFCSVLFIVIPIHFTRKDFSVYKLKSNRLKSKLYSSSVHFIAFCK